MANTICLSRRCRVFCRPGVPVVVPRREDHRVRSTGPCRQAVRGHPASPRRGIGRVLAGGWLLAPLAGRQHGWHYWYMSSTKLLPFFSCSLLWTLFGADEVNLWCPWRSGGCLCLLPAVLSTTLWRERYILRYFLSSWCICFALPF